MRYDENLIEEIRLQNNIVNVISEYVHLTKKGSNHFGLCPFHNEKSPSFSVSEQKQMYYCFGCGAGGNVFTFIMEYENYNFVEAVKQLADRARIDLPEVEMSEEVKREMSYKQKMLDANKEAARYFYFQMTKDPKKKAVEYLDGRGIDEENRKKFGLGYAKFFRDDLYKYLKGKGFGDQLLFDAGLLLEDKKQQGFYYDRFFDRLMFPIFDVHNRVIAFGGRILGDGNPKYLNSPETKLFDKSRNLYGMNIARTARSKKIIIVEGYMDVIALHQAGFNNAVASLGTAFTTGQASLIRRYADEVVIAYDTDGAGVNAALRAIPILKNAGLSVRVLTVEGAKDPDEFIQTYGSEAFESLIGKAEASFMFEVRQMAAANDLKDPEGRTKFAMDVAAKLLTLDNEIERENYLDAIIETYQLKRSAMESQLAKIGKNVGITNKAPEKLVIHNRESKDTIMRAQKNMLTFITSHNKVFGAIKDYLSPKEFPDPIYREVARLIFEAYEDGRDVEPAGIVNLFGEREEQNQVANIFNNTEVAADDPRQFEKMIRENIQIIKRHYIEQLSREVSDPARLQDMITMKRQLDSLNISLE